MDRLTTFKLALALVAAILFIYSLRTGDERARWVAIACLAIAVLLRFVRPSRR
ncbi:MAG TPA: hypothetical protein VFY16_02285 [Gemmatimonadaceae bacterium]|jgi:hypothetical protein|nr:hypothetical protein [Gemmatimonadaceae bacterium]